jgi:hypothetical protein
MLGPSRRLGLWCMLAILSPKQAANDCDSQGDLHQRPSYSSNRVVPLDQSFEGPNADIKETAPAWGLRPLIRTPDGGGVFQSGVPCARHRQAQLNPSCLPVNRSKPHGSICVSAVEALRDCQRWMRRSTKAFHPQPRWAPHTASRVASTVSLRA